MARLHLCVLFLCVLTIAGCHGQTDDEHAVREAVERYNRLLAEGYSRMDMEPLMKVATREEFSRVLHHMIAMREAKLRLESRLSTLEFTSVQITDRHTARVTTRELWDFAQIGTDSGEVNLRSKEVVHLLAYELVKSGETWFVERVNPLDIATK